MSALVGCGLRRDLEGETTGRPWLMGNWWGLAVLLAGLAAPLQAGDLIPGRPQLESLEVRVAAQPLVVGANVQIEVQGTLSDGTTVDLTGSSANFYSVMGGDTVEVSPSGVASAVAAGEIFLRVLHSSDLGTTSSGLQLITRTAGDRDGDGLPDAYEGQHGLNPDLAGDELLDLDQDGLTNLEERLAGTEPRIRDTDGDGRFDGSEVNRGTDPLVADTPGTGLSGVLDPSCRVTVLNRTTRPGATGVWVLPNVPSGTGPVRVRATCASSQVVRSGQSDWVSIPPRGIVSVPAINFESPIPIPERLRLVAASTELTTAGQTLVLQALATYPGGAVADLSTGAGTDYRVSNPAIAAVDAAGVVTARSSGVVLVSAQNEGALAVLRLTVALSGDSDGDGLTDDFELANGLDPNNPVDAEDDADGDGLSSREEFQAGLDPQNPDSDGDTLRDGQEQLTTGTNPLLFDSDGDGLGDGLELATGSNPLDGSSFNLGAALAAVEVSPPLFNLIFDSLRGGGSRQLEVSGRLTDGRRLDLLQPRYATTVSSSDLSICNFSAEPGRVFAGTAGVCTVTASNSGFSGQARITVQNFAPLVVGALNLPAFANDVEVAGNTVFVAGGPAGLHVIDVTNPTAPSLLATLPLAGNANDVRVRGHLVFVAGGSAGLHVIDATLRGAPVLVATLDTPGSAIDLALSGPYVLVADGSAGLSVVRVDAAGLPTLAGSVDTPGTANGVEVAAGLAVVSNTSSPSSVVDLSDPADPWLRGAVDVGATTFDVVVIPPFAYLATASDLRLIDLSAPSLPSFRGAFGAGLFMTDVIAEPGGLLFTTQARPDTPMPIFSLFDPAQPLFASSLGFRSFSQENGDGTGLAADGRYVYMTATRGFEAAFKPGTTGLTRLYVAKYAATDDTAGQAPTVAITAPSAALSAREGSSLTVTVEANDDVRVAAVELLVDGAVYSADFAAPYQFVIRLPLDRATATLTSRGVDFGGNSSLSEPLVVTLLPDAAPSVAITSPAAGAVVTEGASLVVEVAASDDDGVAKVDLMLNGQLHSSLLAPPYRFMVTLPPAGSPCVLAARVVDTAGREVRTASLPLTVVADQPPSVVIQAPADGSTAVAGGAVEVSISASDDVGVKRVLLWANDVPAGNDSNPPYFFVVSMPPVGSSLVLVARAVDTADQVSLPDEVVVTAVPDQPPTVTLTQPQDGDVVVEGSLYTLRAVAVDDKRVVSVTFLFDGEVVNVDTTEPYSYQLSLPIGLTSLTVTAEARDEFDQVGTDQAVVELAADAGTTVRGRVLGRDLLPVAGADVECNGAFGRTNGLGEFSIAGLSVSLGQVHCRAELATPSGELDLALSALAEPVAGGFTELGDLRPEAGLLYAGTSVDTFGQPPTVGVLDAEELRGFWLSSLNSPVRGISGVAFDPLGRLLVTTLEGPAFGARTSRLLELEPGTGQVLADLGAVRDSSSPMSVGDLAIEPATGRILALRSDRDGLAKAGRLYELSPMGGVATLLSDTGLREDGGLAFAADGTLYGAGPRAGSGEDLLLRLDPLTGVTLSELPIDIPFGSPSGLVVRPADGQLLATSSGDTSLVQIDPTSGQAIYLGASNLDLLDDLAVSSPLPPEMTTTVIGRLLDESGLPVSGVLVTVRDVFHSVSGADGRFVLSRVPASWGTVVVTAPFGWFSDETVVSIGRPALAASTTDVGDLVVPARYPATTVVGTIEDELGAPVAGAVVEVFDDSTLLTTTSLANGSFTVPAAPTRTTTLRIFARYSNGGSEWRGSNTVAVVPGGTTAAGVVELHLVSPPSEPPTTVTGLVLDSRGRPAAGATVLVVAAERVFASTTGADGRFEQSGIDGSAPDIETSAGLLRRGGFEVGAGELVGPEPGGVTDVGTIYFSEAGEGPVSRWTPPSRTEPWAPAIQLSVASSPAWCPVSGP